MSEKETSAFPKPSEDDFIPVSRFLCVYCGGIFKTNTKHRCMYSPINRNCLACDHLISVTENGEGGVIFNCKKRGKIPIIMIRQVKYFLNCSDYTCPDNYKGKDSYLDRIFFNKQSLYKVIIDYANESNNPMAAIWLEDTEVVYDGETVAIYAENTFHREVLEKQFYPFLKDAMSKIHGKQITLEIRTNDEE